MFSNGRLFLFLVIVYLFVSGLNGVYPAFVLSSYQPADALKERVISHRGRSVTLRNGLVLFQFVISQILIVGMLVIAGQMKFVSRRDLGFRKDGLLTVPLPAYDETRCETMRNQWMQNTRIQDVRFGF